jgi:LytR cell envelope-related transcriptional attenuator
MEASFPAPPDAVRSWRRATLVAGVIAALELVLLVGVGVVLLAKPLSHALRSHAAAQAKAAAHKAAHSTAPLQRHTAVAVTPKLARAQTKVLVLNGNGRAGAAHTAATRLSSLGYRIAGAANARRQDYATTVVMYEKGYAPEGQRLAHDLGAKVVGPLDGLEPSALHGGELAVILGAS